MKVLFCGDVVGKSGRTVLQSVLPKIREQLAPDMIIVNGENAAHGFGITPKLYQSFLNLGVDVVTLGNHSFDKPDIHPTLDTESTLIRPLNYPENTIGHGYCIVEKKGVRVCVAQVLGRVFMKPTEDPFTAMKDLIDKHHAEYDILIVDVHAEATAEKLGLAYYLDGQASLVLGTHTHIPTADARILPNGTGYQSDIGMCGDYDSIIGMQVSSALPRFLSESARLTPAEGEGTFCGVLADLDEKTGHCRSLTPVCIGAHLHNTHIVK